MRNHSGLSAILACSIVFMIAPNARAQAPRVLNSRPDFTTVAATLPENASLGRFTALAHAPTTSVLQVGRRTYAGEGALVGALAVGAAMIFLTHGLCNADSACSSADSALPVIGGVAGGAILGLLIGGAIYKDP